MKKIILIILFLVGCNTLPAQYTNIPVRSNLSPIIISSDMNQAMENMRYLGGYITNIYTNFTIPDGDQNGIYNVYCYGTNLTITLPLASNNVAKRITIMRPEGSGGLAIEAQGVDTINGLSSNVLSNAFDYRSFYSDNSTWLIDSSVGGDGIFLPLAGGTMSGDINMGSSFISNVPEPTHSNHAVTKWYNDNATNGIPEHMSTLYDMTRGGGLVSFGREVRIGLNQAFPQTLAAYGSIEAYKNIGFKTTGLTISNIAEPTYSNHATTKFYVDSATNGLSGGGGGVSSTPITLRGNAYVKTNITGFLSPADTSIKSVRATVGTAPTGRDILIDFTTGAGTSIFSSTNGALHILAGAYSNTGIPPTQNSNLNIGDQIYITVHQNGTTVTGGSDILILIEYNSIGWWIVFLSSGLLFTRRKKRV